MSMRRPLFTSHLILLLFISVFFVSPGLEANDLDTEVYRLSNELRCVVCQNQTIAESNAKLAVDIRREIRTKLQEGNGTDQIKQYLQQRYGDFILYRPPVQRNTVILWFAPLTLLLIGSLYLFIKMRQMITRER